MFHLWSYMLGIATVVVAECIAAYLLHRRGGRYTEYREYD